MNEATPPGGAAVEGVRLTRSFGGVRAIAEASFAAAPGEVHALVGENGAGKSTMIKVLGGRIPPDSGEVRIHGRAVTLRGPHDAHKLGVGTVFQELMLYPGLTVAENLMLGREERTGFGQINRGRTARAADALLARMGITHIDPLALIEDISLAQRQIVEIVRVIARSPSILFLDEPTSSLVEREVAWLFERVRELRGTGTAVVFTSHRWHEVTAIADRITVFRNGRDVGTFTELDEDTAVTLMTGQRLAAKFPPRPAAQPEPVMSVENLTGARLHGMSFTLRRGEILGVGGLAGQGHRELFFMLFGAARQGGGRVSIGGRTVRIRSPREAKRRRIGLALVPEDRKTEGLLLGMSVRDNFTLSILERISRVGILRGWQERRLAQDMVQQLGVRTAGIASPVGALSGGNQQKVLLGRWLLAEPRILLLYDVTRGVDVATKFEIYQLITRLAAEGRAILFYSSDAEELAQLCHRVLVMREGRIAAELEPPDISAEQIVSAAVHEQQRVAA